MNKNNLVEVEKTIREMLTAHGVGYLDFKWSPRATRTIAAVAGRYVYTDRGRTLVPYEVRLSKQWARVMPAEDIRQVVLHEIAHALSPNVSKPHGAEFKAKVRELGGIATERCYSPSVNLDGSPR